MNGKALSFFKNFSYTLTANIITLTISTLVTLLVPKMIGVESYGYWQLYVFYVSYVGFFHLGWNDGIYLRYGGEKYESLKKRKMYSQFILLLLLQIFFAFFIIISSFFFLSIDKKFILQMVAINLIIVNGRYFFLYILQATNRVDDYAKITIIDRILFVLIVLILLAVGQRDYKLMIMSDILAKALSLLYSMWLCEEIAFQRLTNFYFDFKETVENISAGIKLLFANLASSLIIGVIRYGIERGWDIETFGKVSLTLTLSNLLMIFINGIGIVIYPFLRRSEPEKLRSIYSIIRDILMFISLGILVFYYPFRLVLSLWLPAYSESLKYMALLFPMVVYEGKITLLINTYLKTLRKENILMKINFVSLAFSVIMTIITTVVFNDLNSTVMIILLVQGFRSLASEMYLSKYLDIKIWNDIKFEATLSIIFVVSAWTINSWWTPVIYGLSYIVYLFLKKAEIRKSWLVINEIITRR